MSLAATQLSGMVLAFPVAIKCSIKPRWVCLPPLKVKEVLLNLGERLICPRRVNGVGGVHSLLQVGADRNGIIFHC